MSNPRSSTARHLAVSGLAILLLSGIIITIISGGLIRIAHTRQDIVLNIILGLLSLGGLLLMFALLLASYADAEERRNRLRLPLYRQLAATGAILVIFGILAFDALMLLPIAAQNTAWFTDPAGIAGFIATLSFCLGIPILLLSLVSRLFSHHRRGNTGK